MWKRHFPRKTGNSIDDPRSLPPESSLIPSEIDWNSGRCLTPRALFFFALQFESRTHVDFPSSGYFLLWWSYSSPLRATLGIGFVGIFTPRTQDGEKFTRKDITPNCNCLKKREQLSDSIPAPMSRVCIVKVFSRNLPSRPSLCGGGKMEGRRMQHSCIFWNGKRAKTAKCRKL